MVKITDDVPRLVFETELPRNEDSVMSLSVHPKEKLIACGINGTAEEIKAKNNQSLRLFKVGKDRCEPFRKINVNAASAKDDDYQRVTSWSPNGKLLATAMNASLIVFKYENHAELTPEFASEEHKDEIYDIDWSQDSHRLISTSAKSIIVFDIAKPFRVIQTIGPASMNKQQPIIFRQAKFGMESSEGFAFFAVNTQKKDRGFISKWVTKPEWRQIKFVSISRRPILVLAVSPNGQYLAAVSSDLTLFILSAESLRILKKVENVHGMAVTCLNFTRDSKFVVSGGADNCLVLTPVVSDSNFGINVLLFVLFLVLAAVAAFFLLPHEKLSGFRVEL